jgi:mxaJ protein
MSLPFRERWGARLSWSAPLAATLALLGLAAAAAAVPPSSPLRVCADPNNLPFSNRKQAGFENRIAAVLADELHTRLEYTWAPEWRGFIRKTLGAKRCDVILGVPAGSDRVLTTRPYYTSTYVFLSRRDRGLEIRSLDDSALRRVRIGIHFIGDDYANPPPAHALGRRGIVNNVIGYSIYGDYSKPNPPAELIHAVAKGDIDLAIVWGPFAGYFASREAVPMRLVPVSPTVDPPALRFTFAIAVGVRPGEAGLRDRLEAALDRRRSEVRRILREYGVPLVLSGRRVTLGPGSAPGEAACG